MTKSLISLFFLFLSLTAFSQNENYPIPEKTKELLFYIQRNHNANTIVYDAQFNKNGKLNPEEPIIVYWRRYQEDGRKMELRTIEKWYAYGVDWENTNDENTYKISLVANNNTEFWLKQIDLYRAVVLTKINNKLSVLEHMYIFADESSSWPTVKYIELFGYDLNTKQKEYEKKFIE